MTKKNKRRLQILSREFMHHKRKLGICFLIVLSILICVPKLDALVHPTRYIKSSSDTLPCTIAYLDGKEARQKVVHIPRGSEVRVRQKGTSTTQISYHDQDFTVANENLVNTLEEAIQIPFVYPRRLLNLQKNKHGKLSDVVVHKGEKVKVVATKLKDLNRKTGRNIKPIGSKVRMWKRPKPKQQKTMPRILFIHRIGMRTMAKGILRMPMLRKWTINRSRKCVIKIIL